MKPHLMNVVFDLGNVLLEWDPRHLYRKLFVNQPQEMEWFLANVCTYEWCVEQHGVADLGGGFKAAVEQLMQVQPPELHPFIRAYDERWMEMLAGEMADSVAILEALAARGVPLYALSNWNAEKFETTLKTYSCLKHFKGIMISGEVGVAKPDLTIYQLFLQRFGLRADACVFIDDKETNIAAARHVGMHGLHFVTAERLHADLAALGFSL
jgi:2-haloacid dehalogenase